MATKLQELLEELEGLPKCSCRVDCDGDADYLQTEHDTLIESVLIDQLIAKYSETTPVYPIGGYAPGNYSCICTSCDKEFMGDKRAVQCKECAVEQWT